MTTSPRPHLGRATSHPDTEIDLRTVIDLRAEPDRDPRPLTRDELVALLPAGSRYTEAVLDPD